MVVNNHQAENLYYTLWSVLCWHTGGWVVRVHAIYAADPGLNPGQRSFAACRTPLFLLFPVCLLLNKGVCAGKIIFSFFLKSVLCCICYHTQQWCHNEPWYRHTNMWTQLNKNTILSLRYYFMQLCLFHKTTCYILHSLSCCLTVFSGLFLIFIKMIKLWSEKWKELCMYQIMFYCDMCSRWSTSLCVFSSKNWTSSITRR